MKLLVTFIAAVFHFTVFASEIRPIIIQLGVDPKSLDPVKVTDLAGLSIVSNVVLPIMTNDSTGKLTKGLASRFDVSKDQKVYSFEIRKDAKWSDGKTVTLEDCERGLFNALDPKIAAEDVQLLFSIKNAHEYFLGKKEKKNVGIHIRDRKLIVELEHPDPTFLMALTMPMTGPFREDFVGPWKAERPSTGRYFIRSYKLEDEIDLEPNPFNKIEGQLPIVFKIVPEEVAAQNLFETGKVDIMTSMTPTEMKRLKDQGLVQQYPSATVGFLAFNTTKPPFTDPTWRKAVGGAIDRKGLNSIISATTKPTLSYLPKALDGALEVDPSVFKDAVTIIAASKDKPRIEIGYSSSTMAELILQKVQSDLKRVLGLQVDLRPSEWKVFLSNLKTDAPQIYYEGMGAPFNDPTNHLHSFVGDSKTGDNFARYQNAKYVSLVEQIGRTSGAERIKLIKKAQELLVKEDVIVVPLYEKLQSYGVSKSIKAFKVNPYTVISLSELHR